MRSFRSLSAAIIITLALPAAAQPQQMPAHAKPPPAVPLPPLPQPPECKITEDKADSPGHAPAVADPRTARLCSFIGKQAYRISLLEKKIALLQKP